MLRIDYKIKRHGYTNSEFRELAFKNTPWIEDILEEYSPGKKTILVKSKQCGHICEVACKNLTRSDRLLRGCPKCHEDKSNKKRVCLECGKELSKDQEKFCSNSCSAKFNNRLRISSKKICKNCGKEFTGSNKLFCSKECLNEYNKKERERKVLNGELSKSNEVRLSKTVRSYLFKKYNNSCQLCGWNKVNKFTGKVPLQIHHIDGNPENNDLSNLQVLCPNCHSLTESYSNKNAGKGRESRRKRRLKNVTNN